MEQIYPRGRSKSCPWIEKSHSDFVAVFPRLVSEDWSPGVLEKTFDPVAGEAMSRKGPSKEISK